MESPSNLSHAVSIRASKRKSTDAGNDFAPISCAAVRNATVLSFLRLAGTCRGRSHNNLRCEARSLLVRAGNLALKFRDRFRSNEVNGTATQTAARHSRSEHAGQLSSEANHEVQLGTTDLKIVTQAEV